MGIQSSKKFYDRLIKHSQRINPLAPVQNSVGNAFLSCRNLGFNCLFNFKMEKSKADRHTKNSPKLKAGQLAALEPQTVCKTFMYPSHCSIKSSDRSEALPMQELLRNSNGEVSKLRKLP